MIYQAFAALLVASFATPYIIGVIVIFMIFGIWIFKYSMRAYKEVYRLETTAWSKIISYFSEAFNGITVIRAFNMDERFLVRAYELMNRDILANQIIMGVYCWFALRLEIMSTVVMISGCATCILLRT